MNPRVTGGAGAKMRRSTLGLSMRQTLGPSPLSSGIAATTAAAAAAATAAMAARGAVVGRRPLHLRHAPPSSILASPSPPQAPLRALPGPFWHRTLPGPHQQQQQRRRCAASCSTASLLRLAQSPVPVTARAPKDCHRPVSPPPSLAIPRPSAPALRVAFFSSTSRCLARPSKHEEGPQPSGPISTHLELYREKRPLWLTFRSRTSASTPSDGKPSVTTPPRGIRKVLPIPALPSLTPHENIYTVPNLLTASRIVAAPFIGYAILHDAHAWALGLFVYAGVSDLLDGWIARRWNLHTVVGSIIDPMADKLLMTVLTVCLATKGLLPVWLAALILGRDVGLAISAIYYRWISLPPPKTFMRYWDFSLPSAEVRPTTISKYNTFLQLALMGATTVVPVVGVDVGVAMTGLQYLVATTTVWSGLSYVFSKDAVKILSDNKKDKAEQDKNKETK